MIKLKIVIKREKGEIRRKEKREEQKGEKEKGIDKEKRKWRDT